MKTRIHIIGNGYFGTFLKKILDPHVLFDESSDHKILAVPFEAYQEVAEKYQGKHLINVCSVQDETNRICQKYSKKVTGFHPLFGPRSPEKGRSGIVTLESQASKDILDLFEKVDCKVVRSMHGVPFNGQRHDELMAQTHGLIIWFHRQLKQKVETIQSIPDECLTPSFKALKSFSDFVNELGDFSPGTLSSIKANKYL